MTLTRFQTRPEPEPAAAAGAPALHVVTFGCQMNKYDSLLVEGRFRRRGYRLTERVEEADVVLFNTCSVRDHAEERTYSWLGELKREKARRPELILGVMGCMAQRAEEEVFGRAGHVDIVCGTRRFPYLPDMVDEVRARRRDPGAGRPRDARVLETGAEVDVAVERGGEPYAGGLCGYLAVMRGCDLNCTYCIVPTTRGRVQSRPIADLVREARWMVDGGARVITLLGQTVNSYGEDLPRPGPGEPALRGRQGRPSLADLLVELEELDGLERVRLITLHPSYVTPAFARAVAECSKVDRFLPLPAQSGSDGVLRAMKRGYTTDLYRRRADLLRDAVPDIELGSDWIVGFPGESEADFEASVDFLAEQRFVANYVFKYDPRPGTRSAERAEDVPEAVKKERNQRLLRAAEAAGLARHRAHVGTRRSVFVEEVSERRPGHLRGRTLHGLTLSFPGDPSLVGRSVRVDVSDASPYGLGGTLAAD